MRWLLLPILLFSTSAIAYPNIIKIVNERDNPLLIDSLKRGETKRIPKGTSLEMVVQADDDWRVRYASGLAGVGIWNLDESLKAFIDHVVAATPEVGTQGTLFVLTLTLRPAAVGYTWSTYALENTLIINTGLERTMFTRVHTQFQNPTTLSVMPGDYQAVDGILTTLSHNSNLLAELHRYVRTQREALEVTAPTNQTQTLAGEVTRQLLAEPLIPPVNVAVIGEILRTNMNSQ